MDIRVGMTTSSTRHFQMELKCDQTSNNFANVYAGLSKIELDLADFSCDGVRGSTRQLRCRNLKFRNLRCYIHQVISREIFAFSFQI